MATMVGVPSPACRFPMDGTLDRVAPFLDAALADGAAVERLRGATSRLPAALGNWAHVECRLARGASQLDLIVRVDQRGRSILAGGPTAAALDPSLAALPEWQRTAAFCERWQARGAPWAAAVGRIWLEFDLDDGTAPPRPGVFVELTPAAYTRPPATAFRAAAASLTALAGSYLPARQLEALARCFRQLPAGTSVYAVGRFLARPTRDVRLCVLGLADEAVPRYLASVGWAGSGAALARTLARLDAACAGDGRTVGILHLDVGDGVSPRIGMECVLPRRPQVRGHLDASRLLDLLEADGLCEPAKRRALLAWPGCTLELMPHEMWPSLVTRRVNHVKVVHDERRAVEAKAYLCYSHEYHARAGG